MHPFRNFLAVFPPPTLYNVETGKKILDTRVQLCLWGEGRGWTCVYWKTPQKCKSVPRLLSVIVSRIFDCFSRRFGKVVFNLEESNLVFGHEKNYQVEHYFSEIFSLPCGKRLTLYSPRPCLPTFSLMFINPLNFKCRTSTGYF